jgi:glycosyltransferase involved in cell wall biosynthesis
MTLLVFTQAVDIDDPVLGFFHGWLREFSKHFEKITVVCLRKGKHDLPENIEVLSLGKEEGTGRFVRVSRFYRFLFSHLRHSDAVFVHMNKEYVVMGGIFWRLFGKRIVLWYNHKHGTYAARLAGFLAHTILYTSSQSFFSSSSKARQMPVGVDTELFLSPSSPPLDGLVSLGRISPVKNLDVLIRATFLLQERRISIPVHIYGDALSRDAEYERELHALARPLTEQGSVTFHGAVSHTQAPEIFRQHSLFVNLTASGSFDKTILEAMSSCLPTLSCNESFAALLEKRDRERMVFREEDAEDLAQKIELFLRLTPQERKEIGERFRGIAVRNHSLVFLSSKLSEVIRGT